MRTSSRTAGASISSTATRIRCCRTCSCRGAHIIDLDTGEWLDHCDDGVSARWHGQGYYHWALDRQADLHQAARLTARTVPVAHRPGDGREPLVRVPLRTSVCPSTPTSLRTSSSSSAKDTTSTRTTFRSSSRRCCRSGWTRGWSRAGRHSTSPGCPCFPAPCPPRRSRTAPRPSGSTCSPQKACWTMRSTGRTTTRCIELSPGPGGAGRRPAARARQDGHDHADLHVSIDDALAQGARPPARRQRQRHPGQPLGGVSVFERRRLVRGVGRTRPGLTCGD